MYEIGVLEIVEHNKIVYKFAVAQLLFGNTIECFAYLHVMYSASITNYPVFASLYLRIVFNGLLYLCSRKRDRLRNRYLLCVL